MSVFSNYTISALFSGDIDFADSYRSEDNDLSPASIQLYDLVPGNNTITIPSDSSGALSVAALILPPVGNVIDIILKGANADTGILISPVAPMLLSFNDETEFVLNAEDAILGLKIIWI